MTTPSRSAPHAGMPRPRSAASSRARALCRAAALGAALALTAGLATAQPIAAQPQVGATDQTLLEARDALRKRDRARLAAARAVAIAGNHPLAMWADYWELGNRLTEAQQDELDAFYARWPGSYVEDRLRNDWLLELGRRRDWANFRTEFPRFRMNDDREVSCYALLTRQLDGEDVRAEARTAWLAQREPDDGCALLGSTLYEARRLTESDIWRKARLAAEANRPRVARQAVALLGEDAATAVGELHDNAQRYLVRKASTRNRTASELTVLALIRSAANDADATAVQMRDRWAAQLPDEAAAWVWAHLGKQAALRLDDAASEHFQRAEMAPRASAKPDVNVELPDDTLAWKARAALRANNGSGRWQQVVQAITAMSAPEQRDATWIYWKARALRALAPSSQDGASMLEQSRELLASIAGPLHFYGKLAAEDLGLPLAPPERPAPLTAEERAAASAQPGLRRALQLIAIGLRSEGVREWNFSLRGLGERELLAAAQLACDREVWDRCINTSERTREQVDIDQRFPTPFRQDVLRRAREAGLDPAYVFGLIRQESRFITDARSGVGASGLMQVMPATARWTARKLGIDYAQERITDRDTNLRIGTGYLKLVLDSFDGSQAMAAAAYNAGPGRPRKWREGPALEPAVWAENIPFNETRDYVKKVLSNATDYAMLLSGEPQSLRARLGAAIGPRPTLPSAAEKELP